MADDDIFVSNNVNIDADFGEIYKVAEQQIFYATTATWNSKPELVAEEGYLYIYSDYTQNSQEQNIPAIKVGDGTTLLSELPFMDELTYQHIADTVRHITSAERTTWNEAYNALDNKMDKNNPTGTGSFAVGRNVTALGNYAHAEGEGNTAVGAVSHAEGQNTTASGWASHAEGQNTTASGRYSRSQGFRTIANHQSQTALGEYNVADTSTASAATRGNYVEIVGNGTSESNRSNARTLDWDGNEVLAGDLTYNGNKSITSEVARLDDKIDNLPTPVVFEGTLGMGGTIETLPAASAENEGYMYKVITAGTYQSIECKVGDALISNGSEWVLIPAGDTDSDTWRAIKINGTEKLGNGISSGAVDFINGKNTKVSYVPANNQIKIDLDFDEVDIIIHAGAENWAYRHFENFPDNAFFEFGTTPCVAFTSISVTDNMIIGTIPPQSVDVNVRVRISV